MQRVFLQNIIEDLRFEDLPASWNSFDLESFSKSKKLWDYQIDALKNAIKVLKKYFEDFVDYQDGEKLERNQERKQKFFSWYKVNGLEQNLDIKLDKRKRNIYNLLTEYYPYEDRKISYEHFINRMCFWMATGSGKTLVIIKLIQILRRLIKRKEIPPNDILILTHRDDLIEQFKKMVDEFNCANEEKIILKELKEYPEIKRQRMLFGTPIFYYRSDNLSDEQKVKIIDFKNYDNDGNWYIFLDEAHKGDREEAKRQHIYSILSRNGFLFNSSATFVDPRDVITCAFEFNLSSFINAGYGKHISILKQEIRAFRDDDDYTGEEKQKIVLKSLIFLTYVKKFYKDIQNIRSNLYHNPLLLTLVNSVDTKEADLKLFFSELEKVAKNETRVDLLKKAKDELISEFTDNRKYVFENIEVAIDKNTLSKIEYKDILQAVFNSKYPGNVEVLKIPGNRNELIFKLQISEKPFALIKIGDISGWLKEKLEGYEIIESFENESVFKKINHDDSDINILMGSRAFYEGWDSNRPNIILFVNIGIGKDAKKFVLQSVGRGVRIEPQKNKRKRLLKLFNAKEIKGDLFAEVRQYILPVESLFVFGTNAENLREIIKTLKEEKQDIDLGYAFDVNREAAKHLLLIPVYRESDKIFAEEKEIQKYPFPDKDLS